MAEYQALARKYRQNVLHNLEINKRTNGQYFTECNPFNNSGFAEWSASCDIINQNILEPFAGSYNLIKMLQKMDFCNNFSSFDLELQDEFVQLNDTLLDFPS